MTPVEILAFVVGPAHRFVGRPADGPAPVPPGGESPPGIEIRSGLGIVGDRYFNRPAHRDASVTLIAIESLTAVAEELGVPLFDPVLARRNLVLSGLPDLDALAGRRFSLDSGSGPVELQGGRPARPCAWMDIVLAPGAFRALRGLGGVRCRPTSSGSLRIGPAILDLLD
ncbi:molybdenum cofactor biosysynthesis protein [Nakamurella sp. YIM 132087]|uniref:Molybdenum cofactor biosysynthesis protein n=1 Tax=Nakamurella alba TaxID=2665158 RepID=A0A7K1FST9_9ACTN|nr:MOSC domain-containing protein [Nakamurella alba]MTD17181.1 molybdenum cofactor biosysynthesis protein [Nakamurella alba]